MDGTERGNRQLQQGYPCKGFELEDPYEAWETHMQGLEIIENYGDECAGHALSIGDEGGRFLARCCRCGGYLLVQRSDVGFSDEDLICMDFYPVSSPGEAHELNEKYDGFDIELNFGKRYLRSTNLQFCWAN